MLLTIVLVGLQVGLLALVAWNVGTSLWGLRTPAPAAGGRRRRRLRVVVPAHDEAAVIGALTADLARQTYPSDLTRVVVIADRCEDNTAVVAGRRAEVAERVDGTGGKGAALAWYLDREPLDDGEALVVLDADTRVPTHLLARFADELDEGHHVLQAYLDAADPHGSVLATASALTYWAGNRAVQLARRNLGWSCDLGGTGMCITAGALGAAGGFSDDLAEDQALTARLVLAGYRAVWLHDLRVQDAKPRHLGVAVHQRARWKVGKRAVARRYVVRLLRASSQRREIAPADLALRLVQPGRSLVAVVTGVLTAMAVALGPAGWLLPWPVWAAALATQVALPAVFLAVDGVPPRYLVRYPFITVIALLTIPARIVGGRVRGWYHTPHEPP
ncbi:MAG TPA: glycosyltransferase family 2 protein [Nitriliruptorales bacterium]